MCYVKSMNIKTTTVSGAAVSGQRNRYEIIQGLKWKFLFLNVVPNHFHFFFCGAYNRKYLKNLIYFSLYVKSYKSFQLQEDINVALK